VSGPSEFTPQLLVLVFAGNFLRSVGARPFKPIDRRQLSILTGRSTYTSLRSLPLLSLGVHEGSSDSAPDRPFNFPAVYTPHVRREHPPLHLQRSQQGAPCDGCEFVALCRADAYTCKAFANWQQLHVWQREQRSRPPSRPIGHEQLSQREPAKKAPGTKITAEHRVENALNPAPRFDVSTISCESPTTSGQEPIASSAPSGETLSLRTDEHAANVPRGTIVTASDEVHRLTFAESRAMHARRYLVAVLETTGGERAAAARLAGIGRTTMQALIKRFGISIEFDPLARGRHGRRRSD
jgi:hypothetical protein